MSMTGRYAYPAGDIFPLQTDLEVAGVNVIHAIAVSAKASLFASDLLDTYQALINMNRPLRIVHHCQD